MVVKRQIIAIGGGGFSMTTNSKINQNILNQSIFPNPKICFLPTASGDSKEYIARFYLAFEKLDCTPLHLEIFSRDQKNIENFLLDQDIIYVEGGNTFNMLLL